MKNHETLTNTTYVDQSCFSRRMHAIPRSCIREILSAHSTKKTISFGGGVPHDSCVPLDEIETAFSRVIASYGASAFRYGSSEGEPLLREYIACQWLPRFGIHADPSEILIVSGSQQALDMVGKVFIDELSQVVVEHPTYLAALQAFSAYQPDYREVLLDTEGPLPDELAACLSNDTCRFFYTIPTFQNPSGICCTHERRKALAEVLNTHKTMLVEDDPYSKLYYEDPPDNPICSYGVSRAILLGTFSKLIAPGFRLGWIWTQEPDVMRHLTTVKQSMDLCTGSFQQLLLLETLRQLDMDAHLTKIRTLYKSKRDTMDNLMRKHVAEYLHWQKPAGGMFFWATVKNKKLSVRHLLEKCVAHGVAFADGASFFAHAENGCLRLNFTQASGEEMEEGLKILAGQIQSFL